MLVDHFAIRFTVTLPAVVNSPPAYTLLLESIANEEHEASKPSPKPDQEVLGDHFAIRFNVPSVPPNLLVNSPPAYTLSLKSITNERHVSSKPVPKADQAPVLGDHFAIRFNVLAVPPNVLVKTPPEYTLSFESIAIELHTLFKPVPDVPVKADQVLVEGDHFAI